MPFAYLSCMLHAFAQALGESTFVGYLKAVPQELIQYYSMGRGMASFFGILTTVILMEFGMSKSPWFLLLTLCLFPYYCSFLWIDGYRVAHKQYFNRVSLNDIGINKEKRNTVPDFLDMKEIRKINNEFGNSSRNKTEKEFP
jgi:hypothetical protein